MDQLGDTLRQQEEHMRLTNIENQQEQLNKVSLMQQEVDSLRQQSTHL